MTEHGDAIVARGLTRRFGAFTAVDGVNLRVARGEVYGFLGPNGCGKSTTIRMLSGLLWPTEGEISVLGLRIPDQAEALKRRMGYMTQRFSLYADMTVLENLQFVATVHGLSAADSRRRIDELMSVYHLHDLKHRLSGPMSGGQKQRLALAAAVLHKPELLFLDEPTSAVDPQSRRDFWDALFALADIGTTLLVSTHYMDEAERCHRLAILNNGRVAADGSPRELMDALPNQTLLIQCPSPRQAQTVLEPVTGVQSCAQIGASLRVLAERDAAVQPRIEAALKQAGIPATVVLAPPNLEDVFVAVTQDDAEGVRA